jgi:hypothetical protein
LLSALARSTTTRPRLVLALTLAVLIGFVAAGHGVGDRLRSGGMTDPASQGATAARVLDARFPASRPNLTLLVRSASPAYAAALSRLHDVGQVDSAAGSFRRGRRIAEAGIDRSSRRNGGYEHLTVRLRRGVEPGSEPAPGAFDPRRPHGTKPSRGRADR